jgi:hypothetical protein
MQQRVTIFSHEKLLTHSLSGFFEEKGLQVLVTKRVKDIGRDTSYLVVINLDGRLGKKDDLIKRIDEYAPRTVVINSPESIVGAKKPIKQIYVDNIFPSYVKSAREVYEKAGAPVVSVPKQAWLTIATEDQLFGKVAEELFSFSAKGEILFGKLVSYAEFIGLVNPSAAVLTDPKAANRLPKKGVEVSEKQVDLPSLLPILEKPAQKIKIKRKPFRVKGWHTAILGIVAFFIAIPYILLVVSGASATAAFGLVEQGRFKAANPMLSFSRRAADASWKLLASSQFLPLSDKARLLAKGTATLGRVLAVSDYAYEFVSSTYEGEKDISNIALALSLELEKLYQELSFLEADESLSMLMRSFSGVRATDYRKYVLAAGKLAERLPELLGYDRAKTYLVLLQNNMELRPTGGFIGSFAFLTFSKGELINNEVYDVYSADGQIKGYIKPPKPIEEYLGEASWSLRDSNWDPDFPTSAANAEWFLDKSLDRDVDGVIAVNLEVAKAFLEVLGPVSLADFGDTITDKNLYNKVQFEVEESFFPGSRKKAHYLSALMNSILSRTREIGLRESVELLVAGIGALEARDIQLYLHDAKLQQIFAEYGWDGSVGVKGCSDNCATVFAGIVEANLGVNKANYYIDRKARVDLNVGEDQIEYKLSITFTNNAQGQNRVPEQRYKTYVRALAHRDSNLSHAEYDGDYLDVDIKEYKDRVEYGVLIDLLPEEQKELVYQWSVPTNLDFEKEGLLDIVWWKQSGVGEYTLTMYLDFPFLSSVKSTPPASLTGAGTYLYNTSLKKDFKAEFRWRQL